jgi:hypothetical protein
MLPSLPFPPSPASLLRRPWRSGPFSRFFAFTPLWIRIYGYFAWRTFFQPMFSDSSGLLGIPLGVLTDAFVLFWMSVGVYVLWGARSRLVAGLVYVVFTIPATISLIFGPAIVLILQNAS